MCLKQDYSNLTGGVCLQEVPVCSELFGAANRNSKDLCGRGLALVAASQPAGSALVTLALICSIAWQVMESVLVTGASKETQKPPISPADLLFIRWGPGQRSRCIEPQLR